MENLAGRRIGPYEVVREIARGGQGALFEARHVSVGNRVALKVLLDGSGTHGERFEQEAKVLGRLRHPNLPRVTDMGRAGGVRYLAMELIEGSDLAGEIRSGLPPTAWIQGVLGPVAEALQYCHEQGVVHRDLKPHNVLIEISTGRPVLVDFGLVKRDRDQLALTMDQGTAPLTQAGELLGTPAYMAPEQLGAAEGEEEDEVGPAADVYALGATLFHMLTGQAPFHGASDVNVLMKIMRESPPDPRSLNPDADPALARLALRCLAKSPAKRPASAAAFAAELRQAPTRSSTTTWGRIAAVIVLLLATIGVTVALTLRLGQGPNPPVAKTVTKTGPKPVAKTETEPKTAKPRPVVRFQVDLGGETSPDHLAIADVDSDGTPDLLFVVCPSGNRGDVAARSGRDGSLLWRAPGPTNRYGHPLVEGDYVVFGRLTREQTPELVWLAGKTGKVVHTHGLVLRRSQYPPTTPMRMGDGIATVDWLRTMNGNLVMVRTKPGSPQPSQLGWGVGSSTFDPRSKPSLHAEPLETGDLVWLVGGRALTLTQTTGEFRPLTNTKLAGRRFGARLRGAPDAPAVLLAWKSKTRVEFELVMLGRAGRVRWRLQAPEHLVRFRWADVVGDPRAEVIAAFRHVNTDRGSTLRILDARKKEKIVEAHLPGRLSALAGFRASQERRLLALSVVRTDGALELRLVEPTRRLETVWRHPLPGTREVGLATRDLDGDGDDELIVWSKAGLLWVLDPDLPA